MLYEKEPILVFWRNPCQWVSVANTIMQKYVYVYIHFSIAIDVFSSERPRFKKQKKRFNLKFISLSQWLFSYVCKSVHEFSCCCNFLWNALKKINEARNTEIFKNQWPSQINFCIISFFLAAVCACAVVECCYIFLAFGVFSGHTALVWFLVAFFVCRIALNVIIVNGIGPFHFIYFLY